MTIAGSNVGSQAADAAILLQQPNQLGLLGQKSVVPVVAGHLAVLAMRASNANRLCKAPHIGLRKQPVRADTDKREMSSDAPEGLYWRAVTTQRVPRVHGAQDGKISVRFKAVEEAPALLVEIAGNVEPA